MNKRGISAIVATVMIVLITVAAISIIWVAVIPMINRDINFKESEARISISTQGGYTAYDEESKILSVQVTRGPDTSIDMSEVEIILEFEGNTYSEIVEAPSPNGAKTYLFNLTNYDSAPTRVSVSSIFTKGDSTTKGEVTSDIKIPVKKITTTEEVDEYFGESECEEGTVKNCKPSDDCIGQNKECIDEKWQSRLDILAVSDTHFQNTYTAYDWSEIFTSRMEYLDESYDIGFLLGDIVQYSYSIDEIREYDEILDNLNIKDKFFSITGNHEAQDGGGSPLVSDYYIENISEEYSYNFTIERGNILFILISEQTSIQVPLSVYEWFNKTVAENQDKIIIVCTHRHIEPLNSWAPIYRSDSFIETLNNYHVDIWLYGHVHYWSARELEFDSGKTIFLVSGDNECTTRDCEYLSNPPSPRHQSSLLHLTNGSTKIAIDRLQYNASISNSTPEINESFKEFELSKEFLI